jgi:hypothetical protein
LRPANVVVVVAAGARLVAVAARPHRAKPKLTPTKT